MSETKTTTNNRVSTVTDKVQAAMIRIEEEARAAHKAELASNGVTAKAPITMNTSTPTEAADDELVEASSVTPRAHIGALRGDLQRVDRPFAHKPTVQGPSAKAMQDGARREAQAQLQRLEAAAEAEAAKASFTPARLQADLQAKSRVLSRVERKLAEALKRIDQLEQNNNG